MCKNIAHYQLLANFKYVRFTWILFDTERRNDHQNPSLFLPVLSQPPPLKFLLQVVPTPLTVEQVCALYSLHPKTVQRMARRGEIPAFKVGKNWRFFDVDLVTFFRAQSTPLVSEGAHEKEIKSCHSTKEKTPRICGASSPSKASSYNSLLGLQPVKKQKSLKPVSK
jgi:excisionase family DNA binding protein